MILYVSQIKSKNVEYCKCLVKDILNYLIHLGTFWLRTIQRVLFIAFLEGMLFKNFSLHDSSSVWLKNNKRKCEVLLILEPHSLVTYYTEF